MEHDSRPLGAAAVHAVPVLLLPDPSPAARAPDAARSLSCMGRICLQVPADYRSGRLVVESKSAARNTRGEVLWTCRCDCGNTAQVTASRLLRGHTKSCGCLSAIVTAAFNSLTKLKHGRGKHGPKDTRDRTYITWAGMIQRCHNPNATGFHAYGGRGISVCKAWRDSFESFLNDMGERPEGLSLDRIDGRFGYFFSNCRWATRAEQARNRSRAQRSHMPLLTIFKAQRQIAGDLCR